MARIVKLILTTTTKGKGTEASPMRRVYEYYTTEGNLVTEIDPWKEGVEVNQNKNGVVYPTYKP